MPQGLPYACFAPTGLGSAADAGRPRSRAAPTPRQAQQHHQREDPHGRRPADADDERGGHRRGGELAEGAARADQAGGDATPRGIHHAHRLRHTAGPAMPEPEASTPIRPRVLVISGVMKVPMASSTTPANSTRPAP